MDDEPVFIPLGDADSPMLGLFFFEAESNLDPERRVNLSTKRPLATGMGALVSSDGIVATCAHVVLAMDGWPGKRLTLFGASPSLSVEVQAEVCAEGWRGPVLNEHGERMRSLFWSDLWDARPDVFRQDIAFLKILPKTARWHERAGMLHARSELSPRDELFSSARILPVCRAGYRRPGATLTAWCVAWIHGGPDCQPAQGEFRSFDEDGHHAVRVATRAFGPGFSGGPLWDAHRRVVVGLVRRALPAMGDLVLGTDGLAFGIHSSVALTADSRLIALEAHLASTLREAWADRYADMGASGADDVYIEPQMIAVGGVQDPLANSGPEQALSAIDHLSANLGALKRVVIRGAAGIGKSMLLRKLALVLLGLAGQQRGRRIVPIALTASEFIECGADIGKFLDAIWATARHTGMNDDVDDVLAENGAELAVLVDGLDEIADCDHATVLARLGIRRHGSRTATRNGQQSVGDRRVVATIVTTRSSEAWETAGSPFVSSYFSLFDLQRFDQDRIDAFCTQMIADDELRKRFRSELKKVRWASEKATPLQLRMAASVFRWQGELPKRSIDLTARFVELAIDQARKEFSERHRRPLRDEVRDLYLPHIHEILGLAAHASLGIDSDGLAEEAFAVALNSLATKKSFAWATNPGSLIEFVYRDFQVYLPLLVPRTHSNEIQWAHRTFAEMLGAEHILVTHGSSNELRDRLLDVLKRSGHGQALSLLGVIDRAGDDSTSEQILRDCVSEVSTSSRPQLFALRALGAGIDAKGRMRNAQVKLLVRHLVSDVRERMLCAHIFRQEDLPDAKELLAYPELREDLFAVMLARFKHRLARATSSRPAVVLAREAIILKCANLWPEFLDLGLRRPPTTDDPGLLDSQGSMGAIELPGGDGNVARVLVRGHDGSRRAITVPAGEFVSALAFAARRTSSNTSVGELVHFALQLQLGTDLALQAETLRVVP